MESDMRMSEIRERADKVEQFFEKYPDVVSYKLSTCAEYEKGYYGADAKEALMVRPTVEELEKRGYTVKCSISFGVTDYLVIPKMIMD